MTINLDARRVPVREADRTPGPFPYYGASGIVDYVDDYLFEGEHVLVAEDGENLRTVKTPIAFLANGAFWVNNHAHILRANAQANNRFVMHALNNSDISRYLTGSTMPKLTQGNLARIPLPAPPKAEQDAIAAVLGALDDKIELNRTMSRTLEEIARALFDSWFVRFDPVHTKAAGRHPAGMDPATAALFPDRFQDSELGPIPAEWKVKGLDDIATFLNGLPLQRFPPDGIVDLPVIKIAQLRQGHADGADQASSSVPSEYVVDDGDVLFSWSGTLIADLWIGGRGALNQHLFKVTSQLTPKWFYYLWTLHHLPDFQQTAAGKATTMGHIQRHHLSAAKVLLPPHGLMHRVSATMQPLIDQIILLRQQSRSLGQARDDLLPRLLSGELRIVPDVG